MSEIYCDVSLGDYDGEAACNYLERYVARARKSCVCYECREVVLAGDSYHLVSGEWSGEFLKYRFCSSCWEIVCEFSEDSKTFGVVWETFSDEWESGATLQGCLNRLTSAEAKAHMTRQWRRWKNLEA